MNSTPTFQVPYHNPRLQAPWTSPAPSLCSTSTTPPSAPSACRCSRSLPPSPLRAPRAARAGPRADTSVQMPPAPPSRPLRLSSAPSPGLAPSAQRRQQRTHSPALRPGCAGPGGVSPGLQARVLPRPRANRVTVRVCAVTLPAASRLLGPPRAAGAARVLAAAASLPLQPLRRTRRQAFAAAVAILYNAAGVDSLVLSRDLVNSIFLGQASWCAARPTGPHGLRGPFGVFGRHLCGHPLTGLSPKTSIRPATPRGVTTQFSHRLQ